MGVSGCLFVREQLGQGLTSGVKTCFPISCLFLNVPERVFVVMAEARSIPQVPQRIEYGLVFYADRESARSVCFPRDTLSDASLRVGT